jgi:hypothetical protein
MLEMREREKAYEGQAEERADRFKRARQSIFVNRYTTYRRSI